MAIIMILAAAAASATPIIATVLVSRSSWREDRAWSLAGPPQGRADALARRIVDFHSEGIWPLRSRQRTLPAAAARSVSSRAPKPGQRTAPRAPTSRNTSEADGAVNHVTVGATMPTSSTL